MEFLIKVATFLQTLTKKQSQEYLAIMLGSVCIIIAGSTYWTYLQRDNLIAEIKKIEKLANKSISIIAESKRVQQTERNVRALLEQNKTFELKSFFESFCKEQSLTPETIMPTRIDESNDRYDETVLPVIFKGQTTESMVKILSALEKNSMVNVKELIIKHEGVKKITLEITLATKNLKQNME